MEALFVNVNWLAVGISTIISFMLGALWYSPKMFGIKWAEGVGLNIGADTRQPVPALVAQFIGTLLFAWVVALAVTNGSIASVSLITITFFFLLVAANMLAEHTLYASLVEGLFVLAMAIIMVLCNVLL
ncbi:MAG: twitching motility protein PilT [Gammaproteobacteria bacterium]|nr:twitching motility protein PilT [Gammaproteobacteria bacterium]|tara:strand:- start:318 stop:704 length:387 start_codon:yes stop_codon:yes gene_type:complete